MALPAAQGAAGLPHLCGGTAVAAAGGIAHALGILHRQVINTSLLCSGDMWRTCDMQLPTRVKCVLAVRLLTHLL
jgi:hypothetical protein